MKHKSGIAERSIAFSLRIINMYHSLPKHDIGKVLGKQLLKSGTSIGANIHEAQDTQSTRDFIAKISVAHKEAYEISCWLKIIPDADIVPSSRLSDIIDEITQIIKILSAILITSKKKTG